jgi:hypothetical protein
MYPAYDPFPQIHLIFHSHILKSIRQAIHSLSDLIHPFIHSWSILDFLSYASPNLLTIILLRILDLFLTPYTLPSSIS